MENDEKLSGPDALAAVAQGRAAAVEKMITPWWYFTSIGVATGVHTVVIGLNGGMLRLFSVIVYLAVIGGLLALWVRHARIWFTPDERVLEDRWITAAAIGAAAIGAAAMIVGDLTGLVWPVIALAVLAAAVVGSIGPRVNQLVRSGPQDIA